jgi:succinate dehydrogenase/fumarate reductase iron-sulfur protein
MAEAMFQVFRGDAKGGELVTYQVPVTEGMVVLDGIHWIQGHLDGSLACRWNCKAAKCGSCSAEVNGRPRLMCKTRVDEYGDQPIAVRPIKVFPLIKDLVTDVSWNYKVNRQIPPFTPSPDDPGPWKMAPEDVERLFEFRKCIECFLCQDVCHVLREHDGLGRAVHAPHRGAGDAPQRHPLEDGSAQGSRRDRILQHHQVLRRGVSGAYPHHRQRDHSPQGADGRRLLRSLENAAQVLRGEKRASGDVTHAHAGEAHPSP